MINKGKDIFPSFYQSVCLISFPCLILLTRTFSTILNRSGESRYPWLVPDFRGEFFSFSP